MSDIQNFKKVDPFADIGEDTLPDQADKIHIRIQQRNGRKTITTVQGLSSALDLKKILKSLKKVQACNGTIVEDEEHGDVIQLQGDQRDAIALFLASEGIAAKANIKIHGF
ncbi:Eukaryotic translation initiation factor eIF-1 [Tieghemiomyces parasiticus]|uniref:Eukaryotic translation initiation factor eIF-1 n=1 Tax=Tieghemiomyces parasiticus TaxID=78921 RepID=A0A9W8AH83_9FUNG|nr:Eukaryotic translation initiation factor eIF-1 [Tieghemiomyces parasiticus]